MSEKHYNKKERYSVLKLILRVITLGIAIAALIISLNNRKDLKWLESVQDNVVEKLMFKNQ